VGFRWLILPPTALLLVALGAFALQHHSHAEAAEFPSGFNPYLHRTNGELADPINLIFRGSLPAAESVVQQVLGWQPTQGSQMIFDDRSGQHGASAQFAFNLANGSRYHMRLGAVEEIDGQSYVLAAVHRDDMTACGHVGHNFNQVRDLVASAFAQAGYPNTRIDLKNTTPGLQCDGSYSSGDGYAVIVNLTHTPAAAR
jgi:hypothetical protein